MIEIVNESGRWDNPVVTTVEPLTRFWVAEEYHQDYLQKNPEDTLVMPFTSIVTFKKATNQGRFFRS